MNLAQLIPLVLQLSIALVVFSLALQASAGDLTYLLRRPSLLVRSLLSMNVIMPLLAVLAAKLFQLRPEVEVALILLALAPVPPILPSKQGKAGGNVSYAIGLLMVAALVSLVTVPVSVTIIGRVFGHELQVPMGLVAKVVGISVVVPLVLGALVRRLSPAFAERAAKPLSAVGMIVALLALIPVLVTMWPAVMKVVGDYTLLAIVLFTGAGLAVGTLLGGPASEDRTVLGLATACRHPGVAASLAGAIAPDQKLIVVAVVLAALTSAIITIPYVKMRKKSMDAVGAPARA